MGAGCNNLKLSNQTFWYADKESIDVDMGGRQGCRHGGQTGGLAAGVRQGVQSAAAWQVHHVVPELFRWIGLLL